MSLLYNLSGHIVETKRVFERTREDRDVSRSCGVDRPTPLGNCARGVR
jgi:hypothetical protein